MKKVVVMLVSAAALATVGMAAASNSMAASDQSSSSNASGIFISGNLGYSDQGYKKSDFVSTPSKLDTTGFAWNANAGYQFNQYVAVEGGYTRFADTKATFTGLGTNTISLYGLGMDVKGILPVSSQFDLFAKVGAMRLSEKQTVQEGSATAKLTGNAWTPTLGLGTAFNVNSNVALTLQDAYTFKTDFKKSGVKVNMPATNAILAGVSYKFNV